MEQRARWNGANHEGTGDAVQVGLSDIRTGMFMRLPAKVRSLHSCRVWCDPVWRLKLHVVCHYMHGLVQGTVQVFEDVDDKLRGFFRVARGLVAKYDRWIVDQEPIQWLRAVAAPDSLLGAGLDQPKRISSFSWHPLRFVQGFPVQLQCGKRDVFQYREFPEADNETGIRIRSSRSGFPPADWESACPVNAVERDLAAVIGIQCADDVQQGRLSTPLAPTIEMNSPGGCPGRYFQGLKLYRIVVRFAESPGLENIGVTAPSFGTYDIDGSTLDAFRAGK